MGKGCFWFLHIVNIVNVPSQLALFFFPTFFLTEWSNFYFFPCLSVFWCSSSFTDIAESYCQCYNKASFWYASHANANYKANFWILHLAQLTRPFHVFIALCDLNIVAKCNYVCLQCLWMLVIFHDKGLRNHEIFLGWVCRKEEVRNLK